jgi:hypothetical protein
MTRYKIVMEIYSEEDVKDIRDNIVSALSNYGGFAIDEGHIREITKINKGIKPKGVCKE